MSRIFCENSTVFSQKQGKGALFRAPRFHLAAGAAIFAAIVAAAHAVTAAAEQEDQNDDPAAGITAK